MASRPPWLQKQPVAALCSFGDIRGAARGAARSAASTLTPSNDHVMSVSPSSERSADTEAAEPAVDTEKHAALKILAEQCAGQAGDRSARLPFSVLCCGSLRELLNYLHILTQKLILL